MKTVDSLLQRAKAGEKIEIDQRFKRALKQSILSSGVAVSKEAEKRENPFGFLLKRLGVLFIPALVSVSLFFYFYDTDKKALAPVSPTSEIATPAPESHTGLSAAVPAGDGAKTFLPGSTLTSPAELNMPTPSSDTTALKEKKNDQEADKVANETGRMMSGVATNQSSSPFAAVAPEQPYGIVSDEQVLKDTALDQDRNSNLSQAVPPAALPPEQPNTPAFIAFVSVIVVFAGMIAAYIVRLLKKRSN